MAPRPPLPAGPFLVVGLARSGRAAAELLRARGEGVVGCDAGPVDAGTLAALAEAGVPAQAQADGVALLDEAAAVIKSPGVPQEAPVIRAARERGLPVLGELELGWRLMPNEVIAITGSNGKTTTTELVGRIHREARLPVAVAGNVGTALTSLAGTLDPAAVVVCEASSFQLEDTLAFAPEAAVLLNLAPDHLDRHGTFVAYREAKLRVFANQRPGDVAVLPLGLHLPLRAAVVRFEPPRAGAEPGGASAADAVVRGGHLTWRAEPVIAVADIRLRGAHNLENALAAAAVTLARGIAPAAVRAALQGFAGVAHRLEEVGRADGVLYVDDSKATNVASAIVGLRSFIGGVHAILGGRGKGEDYSPLTLALAAHGRAAYLIGEEAPRLADALAGGVPVHGCGTLDRAVAAARAAARPGDVVLLSPACASYDQYRSFEERGDHFKALVSEQGGVRGAA